MEVTDNSLLDDIKNVQMEAKKLFDSHKLVTPDEICEVTNVTTDTRFDIFIINPLPPQGGYLSLLILSEKHLFQETFYLMLKTSCIK